MANLTEAEKIAHYWAKQTTAAISWTWRLAFLIALIALIFNIWTYFTEHGGEEKRRKGADTLDRVRRRRNDAEDEEKRRRNDEEDNERRKKKEEEEAEKRSARAALQLEQTIEEFR